jgi:hypothetical protein
VTVGYWRTSGALIWSLLVLSCSSGTGPTSGTLDVKLSSPNANDGAVLFTLKGGPVESVEAVDGMAYSAQIDANTLRVVVAGNVSSGTIARVRIADVTQGSRYSVALNQVAARLTYALQDPGLYGLILVP